MYDVIPWNLKQLSAIETKNASKWTDEFSECMGWDLTNYVYLRFINSTHCFQHWNGNSFEVINNPRICAPTSTKIFEDALL